MIEEAWAPDAGDSARSVPRVRTTKKHIKGHIVLDSTWARLLGVRRSGGMYRITRRELMERLTRLQQASPERVLPDDIVELGHSHFVGFYETESFLVDSVRDFLTSGLRSGDAAIMVATGAHRDSFDRAPAEEGVDLSDARRCGRFIALDASETLEKFMVDGMPDATRFRATVEPLISRAAENAHNVRIYGEMVAVLWDEGNVAAAIALEDLWNELSTTYPFSLFCAYPMRAFDTKPNTERFRRICRQHSRVLYQDSEI